MDENVELFIEELLRTKGFSEEDGEGWVIMKEDLAKRLAEFIDAAAIRELPEDKLEELSDLLDNEDFSQDQAAEFLRNSGIDLQKVVKDAMNQFKALFLGEKTTEQILEEQRSDYRKRGVCQYCGSEFKGVFKKVCVNCKRQKDY